MVALRRTQLEVALGDEVGRCTRSMTRGPRTTSRSSSAECDWAAAHGVRGRRMPRAESVQRAVVAEAFQLALKRAVLAARKRLLELRDDIPCRKWVVGSQC